MLRNPGLRKSVEQPVLDLNFAASQIGSNGAPDSRIDFSRGTNAWFVDSDGLVKKSPHNLILQSEDFSTTWSTSGTVSTNTHTAPDGTLTADTASGSGTQPAQTISAVGGFFYGFSVYVDVTNSTSAHLRLRLAQSTTENAWFNLSTLAVGTTSSNITHTEVTNVGGGWYRFTAILDAPDAWTSINYGIAGVSADNGGTANGNLVLWGAQVSQHTTLPVGNPYVKTEGSAVYAARLDHDPTWFLSAAQEQNLFEYSEVVNDTDYWVPTRVSTAANTTDTTAPDGTNTAERFLETGATNTHYIQNKTTATLNLTKGKSYTYSAYVKRVAGSDRNINIELFTTNNAFSPYSVVRFDLDAVSSSVGTGSPDGHSITDEGDGWFRISVTEEANKTTRPAIALLFTDGTNRNYTGDTSEGFYIWGIQLEVGSTASTYHRTEGAPYYGPGATPKGLLIEEARTNLLADSNDLTVDDGFGGNMENEQGAALGPDGTTTAVKFKATSTSLSNPRVFYPTSGTTLTAADYTYSIFLKKGEFSWAKVRLDISGSFDGVFFDLDNGTVGTASSGFTGKIADYGNGWFRCSITATATAAVYFAGVHPATADNTVATSATVGDGLFMWGHSLELGSFPTSYIETTGSTATRNADVATMGPTTGGTELVTNGTYDTDTTGWTTGTTSGTTATVSSGVVTISASTASGAGMLYQSAANTPTVIGRRYRATAELSVVSGSGVSLVVYSSFFSGLLGSSNITSGTDRTVTVDFTATTTATHIAIQRLTSYADTDEYRVDNVSVRELYPFEQYRPDEFTTVVTFDTQSDQSRGPFWLSRGGTNSTGFGLRLRSTTTMDSMVRDSSNNNSTSDITITPAGDTVAGSYQQRASDTRVEVANATQHFGNNTNNIDTSADTLHIGSCSIGGADAGTSSGHIKRIRFIPRQLSARQMKDLCDD